MTKAQDIDFCKQEELSSRLPAREFPFSDEDFDVLSDLILRQTGIVLKKHKKNMVYSRLARRLRSLGLASFSDYLHYLSGNRGKSEIISLINAITTNLTRFFREPHHFDHLREVALPKIFTEIDNNGLEKIRIWSAGCSTGEEPYSVAMILDQALLKYQKSGKSVDAKILATDLDTNVLNTGRKGIYKSAAVETVEAPYNCYLNEPEEDIGNVKISPILRKYIAFKQLNLMQKWPMKGPFDAIFCRNVMIYFDGPTKMELTRRFVEMLKPGGWLYIGHSETILGADDKLSLYGRTIYQRRY